MTDDAYRPAVVGQLLTHLDHGGPEAFLEAARSLGATKVEVEEVEHRVRDLAVSLLEQAGAVRREPSILDQPVGVLQPMALAWQLLNRWDPSRQRPIGALLKIVPAADAFRVWRALASVGLVPPEVTDDGDTP